MRRQDREVTRLSGDPRALEGFITQHERFILKSATRTAKRFITYSDDEWAIALAAFHEAIEKYEYPRGKFLPFARLLIHRALVDFYRTQGKYEAEVPVEWIEQSPGVNRELSDVRLEVASIGTVVEGYGFSFFDVTAVSPKAEKTRAACAKAIAHMISEPVVLEQLRNSKQLPIKVLSRNTGIPRKILERHRKYIIAAAEILAGEYPYLGEYLRYVRNEAGR